MVKYKLMHIYKNSKGEPFQRFRDSNNVILYFQEGFCDIKLTFNESSSCIQG